MKRAFPCDVVVNPADPVVVTLHADGTWSGATAGEMEAVLRNLEAGDNSAGVIAGWLLLREMRRCEETVSSGVILVGPLADQSATTLPPDTFAITIEDK